VRVKTPTLMALIPSSLDPISFSCLRLNLLAGDLVLDLLDIGEIVDLLLGVALPLGVTERFLDVGGAALPLGFAERLQDNVGGFLEEVLLLSG
jgi:hypothetical protein